MRSVRPLLSIAALTLLGACGGSGGQASGPDTAADGSDPAMSGGATDSPDDSAGSSGSVGDGRGRSTTTDDSARPLATEQRTGDGVEFVTTSSTTTTTLPPTTTSTTTSSTTSSTTSTTTTSPTTSTTTTVPRPTTMQCSFAADALFEPGEAVLTDRSIADLGTAVSAISDVRSVRVEGRTDHRGSDAENLTLSQARADAAAAALVDAGVDASLITAVGLGETDAHQDGPSGGPTDEEMGADRRVDVIVEAEVPITTSC